MIGKKSHPNSWCLCALVELKSCLSFCSSEAWRWLRPEPWKTRRRWRSRRCNSKKPNTLLRRRTANTRRWGHGGHISAYSQFSSESDFISFFLCFCILHLSDVRLPVNWWSSRVSWREQKRGQRFQSCKHDYIKDVICMLQQTSVRSKKQINLKHVHEMSNYSSIFIQEVWWLGRRAEERHQQPQVPRGSVWQGKGCSSTT